MEFFYFVKATQKSGKKDAVVWFTAKTEARANLQLDVELEDAGIETGRGKDYQKPARTDFPVYDDLPEESSVDYAWCERYELDDDQRTWRIKQIAESTQSSASAKSDGSDGNSSVPDENKPDLLRPVARLRLRQRLIAHLINDTELKEITEEQHIAIGKIENDDSSRYVQNLLQAAANVPGIKDVSAHVEWNLISAIKQVFQRDLVFTVGAFEEFMTEWVADPDSRSLTVQKWLFDKDPQTVEEEESITTAPVLTVIATLPLRQRLLAHYLSEEYAYHIDADQKKAIQELEMDVDNSYVQNMLLAAENVEPFKKAPDVDISKVITALKTVFPVDGKRVELSLVIQFFKTWFNTEHIDRGRLVKEWSKGNRVSAIQRTDEGTNAGGGIKTDRNPELKHDLDTLDLEIALATLPMDFNLYDIPGSVFRRAKEIVQKKQSPFKEWSEALRSTPGILDYSRAAIFSLIRGATENVHHFPISLQTYINANLTESNHESPTAETLAAAGHAPEVSWENEVKEQMEAGKKSAAEQPEIANMGNGVFSVEGLLANQQATVLSATGQESQNADENKIAPVVTGETTSDVQMEETGNNETQNCSALSESQEEVSRSESTAGADSDATTLNNETGHQNKESGEMLFTHLMVDIEALGKKVNAPVVSIGAVFFDPATSAVGPEFYKVISLESSIAFGGVPDASTIIFWLKASPEARSEIVMDDAIPLDDALLQLN